MTFPADAHNAYECSKNNQSSVEVLNIYQAVVHQTQHVWKPVASTLISFCHFFFKLTDTSPQKKRSDQVWRKDGWAGQWDSSSREHYSLNSLCQTSWRQTSTVFSFYWRQCMMPFLPPLLRKRLPQTPSKPLPRALASTTIRIVAESIASVTFNSKHLLAPKKAIYLIKAAERSQKCPQINRPPPHSLWLTRACWPWETAQAYPAHSNNISLSRHDHFLQGF